MKRFRLLTQAHSFLLFTFVCGSDNLARLISFEFSRAEIENRTTHVCIAGKRTAIHIQKKAAKEWSGSSCLGAIIDMSVPTKRRNPPPLLSPPSGSLQSPRAPDLLPRVQRAGISNITAELDIYHCVSHIPTAERDQTKTDRSVSPNGSTASAHWGSESGRARCASRRTSPACRWRLCGSPHWRRLCGGQNRCTTRPGCCCSCQSSTRCTRPWHRRRPWRRGPRGGRGWGSAL